jgi:hypothetical protein
MMRRLALSFPGAPRLRPLALALLLAAGLSACGPGVGGTGTGVEAGTPANGSTDAPGVAAGSVCKAAFAALLDCTDAASGALSTTGTRPVLFADAPAQARAIAAFSGEHLVLDMPCTSSVFEGDWVASGNAAGRFQGLVRIETGSSAQAATAQVERQGNSLVLQLANETGPILIGTVTLGRVTATPSAPSSCP